MSTVAIDVVQPIQKKSSHSLLGKVLREAARPFRRGWKRSAAHQPAAHQPVESITLRFEAATVEPEGLAFMSRLVTLSRQFPGPIVEIGTLFGRTASYMALFKAPEQKIITVDIYHWNPWGLSRETHYHLTSQFLFYLCQTGQVEQVLMDKNMFYALYRGPAPSMVFLDATHTYEETKKDIAWAKSVGASIISGHDYSDEFPGVKQAVDEFGGPREVGGTVFWLT